MPRIACVSQSCTKVVIADIELEYSRNLNLRRRLISLKEADPRNNFINLFLSKYRSLVKYKYG
jgi:hypothetical protein